MKSQTALALVALMATSSFGQTGLAAKAAASATAPAASTVHATCKDGTPFTGESLRGACAGHGGVDKGAFAQAGSSAKRSTASASRQESTSGATAGKVWANDATKVYHCAGDRYYGKTKRGEYMSESEAKSKGFHADHGKACAA